MPGAGGIATPGPLVRAGITCDDHPVTARTAPWPHGAPCWIALGTGDEERSRAFYGEVLGWEFRDAGPRQHDWTVATVDGDVVAALGAVRSSGSAAWTLGFAVDDVEAGGAAVVNGGGRLLQPAHDILGGAARAAVGRDPGGLRFAMVQAGAFTGLETVNRPGALVWEDGVSDDPLAAREFYREVLGWSYVDEPQAGTDYALFGPADGSPWGGLGGNPAGSPPYWCLWFGVESVDETVDRVIGLGGGVLDGPESGPWGRLARVQDPEGAVFGLMAPDWDALPDRS